MRADGQPELAIRTFAHYYGLLRRGATGVLAEGELGPVRDLPDAENFDAALAERGRRALGRTVVIKLNGGLGTSMGMTAAKSLLPVKDGLSFLDLTARQVLSLRARHGTPLPLLLMDSFRTRADSLAALAAYPALGVDALPLDFVQHRVPKVLAESHGPAPRDGDDELGWCPPGHGDLYTALATSGLLAQLRALGMRWAFVANADNLGAVIDLGILGYLTEGDVPFLMEVADRTESDKKGGHLARRTRDGQLVLRERAQCAPEDVDAFEDWRRHRYFNTNNLWIDLDALARALDAHDGLLGLPLIKNAKRRDPTDPESPPVFQLETAMGAAIEVFAGAAAVRVPRARFAPVKTTNDLLALWSDAYVRGADERVTLAPERAPDGPPVVDLDPRWFGHIDQLQARFPAGAPSLLGCRRLAVRGDVRFGAGVSVRGTVELRHDGPEPLVIPDGARLGEA
ncbi:MAG: UTP--glucose-1-phosphate uridylyltransferase [Deltaproteobacteria bacterium]|nr:MAG: UTP--glucose-1-phosphate uridylyltransferase [Deltaproteobacteria bacterium]